MSGNESVHLLRTQDDVLFIKNNVSFPATNSVEHVLYPGCRVKILSMPNFTYESGQAHLIRADEEYGSVRVHVKDMDYYEWRKDNHGANMFSVTFYVDPKESIESFWMSNIGTSNEGKVHSYSGETYEDVISIHTNKDFRILYDIDKAKEAMETRRIFFNDMINESLLVDLQIPQTINDPLLARALYAKYSDQLPVTREMKRRMHDGKIYVYATRMPQKLFRYHNKVNEEVKDAYLSLAARIVDTYCDVIPIPYSTFYRGIKDATLKTIPDSYPLREDTNGVLFFTDNYFYSFMLFAMTLMEIEVNNKVIKVPLTTKRNDKYDEKNNAKIWQKYVSHPNFDTDNVENTKSVEYHIINGFPQKCVYAFTPKRPKRVWRGKEKTGPGYGLWVDRVVNVMEFIFKGGEKKKPGRGDEKRSRTIRTDKEVKKTFLSWYAMDVVSSVCDMIGYPVIMSSTNESILELAVRRNHRSYLSDGILQDLPTEKDVKRYLENTAMHDKMTEWREEYGDLFPGIVYDLPKNVYTSTKKKNAE